jgi:hypothetical protein
MLPEFALHAHVESKPQLQIFLQGKKNDSPKSSFPRRARLGCQKNPAQMRKFTTRMLLHKPLISRFMAGTTGLEPATSAVTGRRSNQLSYVPRNILECCRLQSCLWNRSMAAEAHPQYNFISRGTHHQPQEAQCFPACATSLSVSEKTRLGGVSAGQLPASISIRAWRKSDGFHAPLRQLIGPNWIAQALQAVRLTRPAFVKPMSADIPRTHCSK